MKTLIFSDWHDGGVLQKPSPEYPGLPLIKKDPRPLNVIIDQIVSRDKIRKVVSLGDLDTPSAYRELFSAVSKYGLRKFVIIGNHEGCPNEGMCLEESREMCQSGSEYKTDWESSLIESRFIKDAMSYEIPQCGFLIVDGKSAYAHASLVNSSGGRGTLSGILWDRFIDERGRICSSLIKENFREMARRNVNVFFRGHDHQRYVFTQKSPGLLETEVGYISNRKLDLTDYRTIASVGALCDGKYTIFDDETGDIEFRG